MRHVDDLGSTDFEARVGEAVRRLRQNKGWTQEQLAHHLSEAGSTATQSTVARLEGARRPLRLNDVALLAQVLGVDLVDLLSPLPVAEEQAGVNTRLRTLEGLDLHLLRAAKELEDASNLQLLTEIRIGWLSDQVARLRRASNEVRDLLQRDEAGALALAEYDRRQSQRSLDDHLREAGVSEDDE